MLAFGLCLALAVLWRKKPEFHRRLIFIATCVLLDAAFGRIGSLFDRQPLLRVVWTGYPLGVVRDLLVNRSIHKSIWLRCPC